MSRKTVFRLLIIIIIILILGFTAFLVDVNLVFSGDNPKFCFKTTIYEDGGTKEYIGIGYKIFKYNTISGNKDVKFGTLFLKYSDNQDINEVNKKVNIIGEVKNITKSSDRVVLYIEANDSKSQYEKAYVSITKDTALRKNKLAIKASEIEVGNKVQVIFTGAVAQSYPPQATARVLTVVE